MATITSWRDHFTGKPFSAVFTHPQTYPRDQWRIRSSVVNTDPGSVPTTAAVLDVCEGLGVMTETFYSSGPCSANVYPVQATFLDGGVSGETRNYIGGKKGGIVTGEKAVLLLALSLGLWIRPAWYADYGVEGVSLNELLAALRRAQMQPLANGEKLRVPGPGFFLRDPRRLGG